MSIVLSAADYHRQAREISEGRQDQDSVVQVAVLGSFTLDFIRPFLIVEGNRCGLRLAPRFGPFGQLEQQIGDPSSDLYTKRTDVLVLAMRPEDVAPDAILRPFARNGPRLKDALADVVHRLASSVELFRTRSKAPVLVAGLAEPTMLPLGPFDANNPESLTHALAEANKALRDRVAAVPSVALWDWPGLIRSCGAAQWTDERLWALARVPVAQRHQPALAAHLARSLRAMLRPPAKCLVLDLDNTIWGGVIGDDGLGGIQLGDDYPGNVYKNFQRRVLGLMDRGVLLAVVSKNDEVVVREAFDRHPDMLIRWADLAAARINWGPKSANIRQVAADLNIGADALVLFDDNPVEQAEVRLNAPEVLVPEVPNDPLKFAEVLAALPWFDQPSLSEEDRARTDLYRQQRERVAQQEQFGTIDEFLTSLEMIAEVGEVNDVTLARVAQLINKTNQFNLTTRRHAPGEVSALAADPQAVVAWLRLADRFGDQGLVAVAILRREESRAVVDTFLMSCRVMNRRVETALAAYLVEHARRLGCREVEGEYLPTAKNGMVKGFYRDLGFNPAGGEGSRWVLDLTSSTIEWPSVIRRVDAGAGAAGTG